jgi:hypothetical protein
MRTRGFLRGLVALACAAGFVVACSGPPEGKLPEENPTRPTKAEEEAKAKQIKDMMSGQYKGPPGIPGKKR